MITAVSFGSPDEMRRQLQIQQHREDSDRKGCSPNMGNFFRRNLEDDTVNITGSKSNLSNTSQITNRSKKTIMI